MITDFLQMEKPRLRFILHSMQDIGSVPAVNGWKLCKPNSVVDVEFGDQVSVEDRMSFCQLLGRDERVYVRHFDQPKLRGYSLGVLILTVLAGSSIAGIVGYMYGKGGRELLARNAFDLAIIGAFTGLTIVLANAAMKNWRALVNAAKNWTVLEWSWWPRAGAGAGNAEVEVVVPPA